MKKYRFRLITSFEKNIEITKKFIGYLKKNSQKTVKNKIKTFQLITLQIVVNVGVFFFFFSRF